MKYVFTFSDIEDETQYGVLTYVRETRRKLHAGMFTVINDKYTVALIKKVDDNFITECSSTAYSVGQLMDAAFDIETLDLPTKFMAGTSYDALTNALDFADECVHFDGEPTVIMDSYAMAVDLIRKGMRADSLVFRTRKKGEETCV